MFRTLAATLLLLTTLSIKASVTIIYFDLEQFNASPTTNRTVTLQALSPFPGNLVEYSSGTNGYFYASNLAVGDYVGEIKRKGQATAIPFQVTVTSTNLGIINAHEIFSVGGIQTYPQAGRAAWSISASDARYAPIGATGGDVTTSQLTAATNTVTTNLQAQITTVSNSVAIRPGITNSTPVNMWATNSGAAWTWWGDYRNGTDGERYYLRIDANGNPGLVCNGWMALNGNDGIGHITADKPGILSVGADVPWGVMIYGAENLLSLFPQQLDGKATNALYPHGAEIFGVSADGVVKIKRISPGALVKPQLLIEQDDDSAVTQTRFGFYGINRLLKIGPTDASTNVISNPLSIGYNGFVGINITNGISNSAFAPLTVVGMAYATKLFAGDTINVYREGINTTPDYQTAFFAGRTMVGTNILRNRIGLGVSENQDYQAYMGSGNADTSTQQFFEIGTRAGTDRALLRGFYSSPSNSAALGVTVGGTNFPRATLDVLGSVKASSFDGSVSWTNLTDIPAGFADGTVTNTYGTTNISFVLTNGNTLLISNVFNTNVVSPSQLAAQGTVNTNTFMTFSNTNFNSLFVSNGISAKQLIISNTNGATPGIIITNGGIKVMGGVSYFDQSTAAISSNSTYFASGLINVYKDGSMTWANDAAGVSSNGVWRGSGAELTDIPTNFPSLNVTNKVSVGSLSVGGRDLTYITNFSTNTISFGSSNYVGIATNGTYQFLLMTNDIVIQSQGTGAYSLELDSNGTNRIVSIPTNYFNLSTNGLSSSGTNWQVTILAGKRAWYSEVARLANDTNRTWCITVQP